MYNDIDFSSCTRIGFLTCVRVCVCVKTLNRYEVQFDGGLDDGIAHEWTCAAEPLLVLAEPVAVAKP